MPGTSVLIQGLAQGYGSRQVLFDISVALDAGITALLGLNGAGKRTLIRSLAGDLPPWSGSITLGCATMSARWDRRQLATIGYLPQDPRLPGHIRVGDAIAYAQWLKCGQGGVLRQQECLAMVELADHARAKAGTLSGGMRRRLALACAIVSHPKLLLLDEPTVGLDPEQRSGLRRIISRSAQDCALVFSTHELAEVDHFDPGVVVIHGGRILFSGTAEGTRRLAPIDTPAAMRLEGGFLTLDRGRLAMRAYRILLRISWTRYGAPLTAAIALLSLTADQGWVGGSASTAVAVMNAVGLALPVALAATGLDGARDRHPESFFAPERSAQSPLRIGVVQFAASTTWPTLAYVAVVLGATVATGRANSAVWPPVLPLAIGYLSMLALVGAALAIGRHTPVLIGLLFNSLGAALLIGYLGVGPESRPALFTLLDSTYGPPGMVFNTPTGLRQLALFGSLIFFSLVAFQRRLTGRMLLVGTAPLLAATPLLLLGSPQRWILPADPAAVSSCHVNVCLWRDHAALQPDVLAVVNALLALDRNGLPAPARWQESASPEPGAASFYLGTPHATRTDVGSAIAQGYLLWLSCGQPASDPSAIAREQWLSGRLVPTKGQTLEHVSEIESWSNARQWDWFAAALPRECRPA